MTLNLTTFDYALQEMYPDIVARVNELDTPLLSMIKSRTDFTGKSYNYPTVYANNAGRAGTLTAAQTASTGGVGVQWALTAKKDYGVIRIDGETIRASGMGDNPTRAAAAAFLSARAEEMFSTMKALREAQAHSLFRDGSGVRGVRASAVGNVITLTNATDAIFFDVGMVIGAAITGGGAARAGTATITAVSRGDTTSTITVDNIATIAAFADTDTIYVSGDYLTRLDGLGSWVPSSAPSATPFYGVVRTADVGRLGGLRYSGTEPLVERLVNAEAFCRTQGGKIDLFVMHPTKVATIKNILGDKIRFVDVKSASGKASFRMVEIDTDHGAAKVLADPFCPVSRAWGLQLDTWEMISRGAFPGPLDHLGNGQGAFFTMTAEDSIEGRLGGYVNLGCKAPGYNVTLAV
jgi:hypothetical protein